MLQGLNFKNSNTDKRVKIGTVNAIAYSITDHVMVKHVSEISGIYLAGSETPAQFPT